MLQNNPKLRIFLSAVLGFAGGNSLSTSVFPFATALIFKTESFDMLGPLRLTLVIAALWAAGASIVGARGGIVLGLIVMGVCGLVSGVMLGVSTGIAGQWLTGALIGTVYSIIGGLILGTVFRQIK